MRIHQGQARLPLFLCFILFLASGTSAARAYSHPTDHPNGRARVNINKGWGYSEDRSVTPAGPAETAHWQHVDLPHSWNVWDAVDAQPGYRRDISWYRRPLPEVRRIGGGRVLLDFEGVNFECDIYVNGERAGGHVGGYVGFTIDITPFLKAAGQNELLIRVSNAYNPHLIPSQKSDFFLYGGITRDVWLLTVPSTSISALRIRTPEVSTAAASTVVDVDLANKPDAAPSYALECAIIDDEGTVCASKVELVGPAPSASGYSITLPPVPSPRLWSPDDPYLYTIRTRLLSGKDVIDEVADRVGYRWFQFVEHGPFLLNGKRLLLRGTHRHEDWAGYANAMPDSLHRRDMELIKEVGANFVRLGHYPQDPEVYRSCDELGLLVWDELPWCRGGMGGEEWKANTRRLLKEQILRYYNHPSIIIRSLGNEMYWLPDFPGGDDTDSLKAMIAELHAISHELDPGRLTATRKFTEGADLVDLVSPSIWPGWYSGYYKMFGPAYEDARKKYARFFHAEWGGSSHVGRHSEAPISGDGIEAGDGWEEKIKPQKVKNVSQLSDWNENYIVDLFDWGLHVSEGLDWLTGNAQWAFKDFPTPLRPENPIPYINQKGLVDRAGNPKDAYYVFKSHWTTSPSFCYIESHTWTERSGPEQAEKEIAVFSNCGEVELVHNGTSLGKLPRDKALYPAQGFVWKVRFASGGNTLLARGFNAGTEVCTDTLTLNYSIRRNTTPDRIMLESMPLSNGTILISATVVDAQGQRCLDYEKRVYFTSDGPGRLLDRMGTPDGSSVIEMANGQASIRFAPSSLGPSTIEVRNQDFKGSYLTR